MRETTVYLVRHGMHDWLLPADSRLAGRLPGISLNAQGIEEVRRVAARLAGAPIVWIASSPLERTAETATIIARDRDIAVTRDDRLLEWRFGPWEGMRIDEIRRRYPREWDLWRTRPDELHLPEAETLEEVAARMAAAYRDWSARGGVGVIVSHQDPLSALLVRLMGAPLQAMRTLDLPTGAVCCVRQTPHGPAVAGIDIGERLAAILEEVERLQTHVVRLRTLPLDDPPGMPFIAE